MSNLVQSYTKRGVATSHAWQRPGRLFFVLAMMLIFPISQSVAAISFSAAELNLASVDFGHRGGRGGFVDVVNDAPQLKTGGNNLGAEYSSVAELGCRPTQQSSGLARPSLSGTLAVRRIQCPGHVNGGQIINYQHEPVATTMTILKISAAKPVKECIVAACIHVSPICIRARWRAIDVGQFEYNRER